MIDLHMHILPGIDDGARSLEDAVAMAAMAKRSGVKGIAATSHANLGPEPLTMEAYAKAYWLLREELERAGIDLMLFPGMEVFMDFTVGEKLAANELLTINNTKYVLVEFDFGEELWMVNDCLEQLEKSGYIPLIAHAERYVFVQNHPEEVFDWVMRGYGIQVNKSSFLGAFGKREQNTAMSLLNHGLVHVVASDAHGLRRRTPSMEQAMDFLSEQISGNYMDLLFEENPKRIIRGEKIISHHPRPYTGRRYR